MSGEFCFGFIDNFINMLNLKLEVGNVEVKVWVGWMCLVFNIFYVFVI